MELFVEEIIRSYEDLTSELKRHLAFQATFFIQQESIEGFRSQYDYIAELVERARLPTFELYALRLLHKTPTFKRPLIEIFAPAVHEHQFENLSEESSEEQKGLRMSLEEAVRAAKCFLGEPQKEFLDKLLETAENRWLDSAETRPSIIQKRIKTLEKLMLEDQRFNHPERMIKDLVLNDKPFIRWGNRRYNGDPLAYIHRHPEVYAGVTRRELELKDPGLYTTIRRMGLLHHFPRAKEGQRGLKIARNFGKDLLTYYEQHYDGLSRGKLCRKDPSFYNALMKNKLLHRLPSERENIKVDPLAYYRQHYSGLSVGQLKKKSGGLYRRLKKTGLLHHIPRRNRILSDPLAYYQQHYAGLSRSELGKEDNWLYYRLRNERLIHHIPKKKRKNKYGDNPFAYYQQHYAGLSRSELKRTAGYLYVILRSNGLIDNIPRKNRDEKVTGKPAPENRVARNLLNNKSKYGDDPLAYYEQHFPGLTRGELSKQHNGLYDRLWRDGLLKHVPRQRADFGSDPLVYYRQKYPEVSRGQLRRKHKGLYYRLKRDGLLDCVPKKLADYGDNPLACYQQQYAGCTRGELNRRCRGLYERLRRDGLLNAVPIR